MIPIRATALTVVLLSIVLSGCGNPPRTALTAAERRADLEWLFREIERNYAPLEMKQKRWRFDYAARKKAYLEESDKLTSNDAFYRLVHRFAAELKDAHVQVLPPTATVTSRKRVATLGFDGVRQGDALVVTKILPTSGSEAKFPVKVGDRVLALDDVKLVDLARTELLPYRNLGEESASLNELFPKTVNRSSLALPMPTRAFANLEIERNDEKKKVRLPWIEKDIVQAMRDERDSAKADPERGPDAFFFGTLLDLLTKRSVALPRSLASLVDGKDFRFGASFLHIDASPTWSDPALRQLVAAVTDQPSTLWEKLKTEREVPTGAIAVNPSGFFPSYVFSEPILDKEGKKTKEKRSIGYVYLPSFALEGFARPRSAPDSKASAKVSKAPTPPKSLEEDDYVADLATTLKAFRTFRVEHVVVDLLDNGGGSVTLGLRLAQLFARARLAVPSVRFRVSDWWLDYFEERSLHGENDAERSISQRVYDQLAKHREKNDRLSNDLSFDALLPLDLQANDELDREFELAVLVNESCASMCDLFAATLKDNRLATIVGSGTMGAGGNVRMIGASPYAKFGVSLTESMALRRDGSVVENAGVEPDVKVDTSAARKDKFSSVLRAAVERWIRP